MPETKPGHRRHLWRRWTGFIGLLLAGVITYASVRVTQEKHFLQCKSNLKSLGYALQIYHDLHGSFPPAVVRGPDGRPWHSWRILVLSGIEPTVYRRYRFDEPWNGPNNRRLAAEFPSLPIFRCPGDAADASCSYFAVVGRGTMWPPGESLTNQNVSDGLFETIHLVEVSESSVHWMEPRDLRLDSMTFVVNADRGVGIRSRHPGELGWNRPRQANVVHVDVAIDDLDSATEPETVRSMLLRNDDKP